MKANINGSTGTDMTPEPLELQECRGAGYLHATDIPRYNRDVVKDGMDEEEAKDACYQAWGEAEENSRQFSPFEFTAKALNDASNSEEAWEAFDSGIQDAFDHGWKMVQRDFTFS